MKRINLKDFVLHFCFGRNAEEAAEAVGIDRFKAKTEGLKLLSRKSVINKIKSEDLNKQPCDGAVIAGLERLAFGRINDAVSLTFSDEITDEQIHRADLFNVSEIKKVKGGGVEIKFFDRQKALERLWEYNENIRGRGEAKALVEALCKDDEKEVFISDSPQGDDEE